MSSQRRPSVAAAALGLLACGQAGRPLSQGLFDDAALRRPLGESLLDEAYLLDHFTGKWRRPKEPLHSVPVVDALIAPSRQHQRRSTEWRVPGAPSLVIGSDDVFREIPRHVRAHSLTELPYGEGSSAAGAVDDGSSLVDVMGDLATQDSATELELSRDPCASEGGSAAEAFACEFQYALVRIEAEEEVFNWWAPHKPGGQRRAAGSGFATVVQTHDGKLLPSDVEDNPVFVTSADTVMNTFRVTIQLPAMNQQRFPAYVSMVYDREGLALVHLQDPAAFLAALQENKAKLKILPLRANPDHVFSLGQQVASLGFPLDSVSIKYSRGELAGSEQVDGRFVFQSTAAVSRGSDGGPLFALGDVAAGAQPEVIAVSMGSAEESGAQNQNYAIPVQKVRQMIYHCVQDAVKCNVATKLYMQQQQQQTGGANRRGNEESSGDHERGDQPPKKAGSADSEPGGQPPKVAKLPTRRLKVAPVMAVGIQVNDVLRHISGECQKGLYLAKIPFPSVLEGIPEGSFLEAVDGIELDQFGMGRSRNYFQHPLDWQHLLKLKERVEDEVELRTCKDGVPATHKVSIQWVDEKYEMQVPFIPEPFWEFSEEKKNFMLWDTFAGIVVMEMSIHHVLDVERNSVDPDLAAYMLPDNRRQKRLIVIELQSGSYASEVLEAGMVIKSLNGKAVTDLNSFHEAFVPDGQTWRLDFERGDRFEIMFNDALLTSLKEAQLANAGYSQFIQYKGSRIFQLLQSELPLLEACAKMDAMEDGKKGAQMQEVGSLDGKPTSAEPRGNGKSEHTEVDVKGNQVEKLDAEGVRMMMAKQAQQVDESKKKLYLAMEKEVPHMSKVLDLLISRMKGQMVAGSATHKEGESHEAVHINKAEVLLPTKMTAGAQRGAQEAAKAHPLSADFENAIVRISCFQMAFNYFSPELEEAGDQGDTGSGFAVALQNDDGTLAPANAEEDPIFITNAHVVRNGYNIRVQLPAMGQDYFDAYVPMIFEGMDLAIVRLKEPSRFREELAKQGMRLKVLPIIRQPRYALGLEVAALGFPLGVHTAKLSVGVISGTHEIDGGVKIQMTAQISPGSSGGPLFDLENLERESEPRIIGVNFAAATQGQSNNYAIPVVHIRQLLHGFMRSEQFTAPRNERGEYKHSVLRLAPLAVLATEANEGLRNASGGCDKGIYISKVESPSVLEGKVAAGDFLVSVNGHPLDAFGNGKMDSYMGHSLNWDSIMHTLDDLETEVQYEVCRAGRTTTERTKMSWQDSFKFQIPYIEEPHFHPELKNHETFGGMTFVEMTLNHVSALLGYSVLPRLAKYMKPENRRQKRLIIVHIQPGAYASEVLNAGVVVTQINDKDVTGLDDYRKVFDQALEVNGRKVWKLVVEDGRVIYLDFSPRETSRPAVAGDRAPHGGVAHRGSTQVSVDVDVTIRLARAKERQSFLNRNPMLS